MDGKGRRGVTETLSQCLPLLLKQSLIGLKTTKAVLKRKSILGNQQIQEVAGHRIADTYSYLLLKGSR